MIEEIKLNNGFTMFLNEPDADYHEKSNSGEFLSSHKLAEFRKSPRAYYENVLWNEDETEDNPAYAFGRAFHTLALEGQDVFNERYVVSDGPINAKTGKPFGRETSAYKAWRDGLADGATPISNEEYDTMRIMDGKIQCHDEACTLFSGIKPEVVIRGEMCGVKVQVRLDAITPNGDIFDLKTTADLTQFDKDFWKFGYHYQAAFYAEVYRLAFGRMPAFYFVAVEKKNPFSVGVFEVSEGTMGKAIADNIELLKEFNECDDADHWPTRFEGVRSI